MASVTVALSIALLVGWTLIILRNWQLAQVTDNVWLLVSGILSFVVIATVLVLFVVFLAREITELRVVHGKGKGHMRRTVHAILDSHPAVEGYRLAGHGRGSWGATLVELKSPPRR